MKAFITTLVMATVLMLSGACEPEKSPAKVWGTLQCDKCAGQYNVSGTLAKGGEDYWGTCKLAENGFSFSVGDANPGALSNGYYFSVSGVSGTPTTGVYESGETLKNDSSYRRSFSKAEVHNGPNVWRFNSSNFNPDNCYVALFAEATADEVTPQQYDNKSFDYFVEIRCTGISVPNLEAQVYMESFFAKVWFDNCD